jgi:hypothetical protein
MKDQYAPFLGNMMESICDPTGQHINNTDTCESIGQHVWCEILWINTQKMDSNKNGRKKNKKTQEFDFIAILFDFTSLYLSSFPYIYH